MQLTQHMGITGGVILPPVWFRTGHTCWLLCWCKIFPRCHSIVCFKVFAHVPLTHYHIVFKPRSSENQIGSVRMQVEDGNY